MFKIATDPTYTAPVTVQLPGEKTPRVFDAVFARLSQPEIEVLLDQSSRHEIKDADVARRVLRGWRGVQNEDGSELPFSPSSLDQLLAIYPVPAAIVLAFFESISGARLKN